MLFRSTELAQLPCVGPVLERVLYPHYLAHPIGIGKLPLASLHGASVLTSWLGMIDLHESGTVERSAP